MGFNVAGARSVRRLQGRKTSSTRAAAAAINPVRTRGDMSSSFLSR